MHDSIRFALPLVSVFCIFGCGDPEYSLMGSGRVNSAGASQLMSEQNEVFTAGRLAVMVEAAASSPTGILPDPLRTTQVTTTNSTSSPDDIAAVAKLDQALGKFARAPYLVHGSQRATEQNRLRDARNMIQDQLIAASNNRCNVYKTHLRRLSTNSGFALGGLATAAGAAGAIVTGAASQALAGAASALSGINAEYQKDFFNGLVTAVIIPGIDRQRADIRNGMMINSCAGVTDYPLTFAIAEAIRYHGACSADVGIAASGQAIARSSPDSLSTVLAATQQINKIRAALNPKTSTSSDNSPMAPTNSATSKPLLGETSVATNCAVLNADGKPNRK